MDHLLLITLLFSGLCSVSSRVVRRYHFVNEKKMWEEAQEYCRCNFTDLATVEDTDDMTAMTSTVKDGYAKEVWIGLNKTTNSTLRWSVQGSRAYSLEETNFTSWGSGEPNDLRGNEDCTLFNKGRWNDVSCKFKNFFICYNESGNQNKRYILIEKKKKWIEAQQYCRVEHTDLASVRNQTENNMVDQTAGDKNVWIGLFKDYWKWSDQTTSAFRFWSSGKPNHFNKDCAVTKLHKTGKWEDRTCTQKHPFFCYEECPYDLFLIRENKTWMEALDYCNRKNMELVSASSSETQGCVKEVTRGASTAHVWMGLSFLCPMELWIWISGVMLCSDDWAHGNGTGRNECGLAGALQSGGQRKWVSRPMNEKLNFICSSL
ncbi:macrophage mannose receptor 1-like [Alosa sapidissima]|uniref:macrophage mannose receptor 1-like n=1 Tax=Alosa sapidissima TaxID=34773 RepID=UPI001C09B40F|nr:macrophage mannose receptor 1-like [Alosa sapidissima]XP_041934801.1 macrophage mannose receptor 1-like [Alosa sapidissima]